MASVLRESCLDQLSEDETVVFLEPEDYDLAIVGIAREFGRPPRIAYAVPRILAMLKQQGMSDEEAVEYFDFNTAGAYMGEGTPVFIYALDEELRG